MKSFILIAAACLWQTVFAAPQLISFKDGRVGVNFLGYHAEAGLGGGGENGGLLGGLHASAGTPWGQNAAAGLGGNVNGRAAGMLYAGAQATPDVGASAVLGGDTSRGGFSGTDAYANGKVASRTKTISSAGNTRYHQQQQQPQEQHQPQPQENDNNQAVLPENTNAIQKIKPPKKFYSSERTKNRYDNEQQQKQPSSSPSSIFIAKTINKTTITTPFQTATKGVENPITIETAAAHNTPQLLNTPQSYGQQILSNDADIIKNIENYETTHLNTAINIKNAPSLSLSSSLLEPEIISYISLNSSNVDDDDNTNGQIAIPSTIITRERFQLRNRKQRNQHQHHPHHHQHYHQRPQHPKRIQRQRQRSKTIVKVLEQVQQQQHPLLVQQNHQPEELLPPNYQQQHHVRRQFIAPQQASAKAEYPAAPCDAAKPECNNPIVHRPVRSDVVQNALQIPIGILQSLQSSLGNLGVAPVKGL